MRERKNLGARWITLGAGNLPSLVTIFYKILKNLILLFSFLTSSFALHSLSRTSQQFSLILLRQHLGAHYDFQIRFEFSTFLWRKSERGEREREREDAMAVRKRGTSESATSTAANPPTTNDSPIAPSKAGQILSLSHLLCPVLVPHLLALQNRFGPQAIRTHQRYSKFSWGWCNPSYDPCGC